MGEAILMRSFDSRHERVRFGLILALSLVRLLLSPPAHAQADPLPSWNEGPSRTAIVEFVRSATVPGSTSFVPEAERIATFDNDGTLWVEQPIYTQVEFA